MVNKFDMITVNLSTAVMYSDTKQLSWLILKVSIVSLWLLMQNIFREQYAVLVKLRLCSTTAFYV